MSKFYKITLAVLLCMFGASSINAAESTPLSPELFFAWDGWGADAHKTGPADCLYVLNESTGQPYGDPSVINYADLSLYSKLVVTCTEGTPRFLFNRTVDEGQYNANEEESNLLEYPKNGWTDRYFTVEGSDYIVDLKKMVKEKGFAHLHAIKGANWGNVTVTSMELYREGKSQVVGWVDLVNNGDMEGDDVSSFFSKEAPSTEVLPSVIYEGVGVDGSRAVMVQSADNPTQDWDTQFWIYLPENLAEGTKYRVQFDYRSDIDGGSDTQSHAEPGDYIHYEMIGSPNFTTEWQHWDREGVITAQQAGPNSGGGLMHSVAFNLSKNKVATQFFFDNIKFEVFKLGTMAEFSNDVIEIDFGFETNMAELVKACGKKRLMYPLDCASVNVGGETKALYSVEGFEDGRFYIFLEEALNDDDIVEVTFINPTDPAYHLIYTSGPGGDVNNFTGEATLNSEIEDNEGYPYAFLTPVVMVADPEDGSFNLPNSINEFKLKFDKNVDCAALVAKLNNDNLTVVPAEGFAEEITLSRSGGDLVDGEYTIHVTKIYPELRLSDEIFGDTLITINVGKTSQDPNDVPKDLLPDYLAEANANSIPEGYIVIFDGETREWPNTYSSGARMFDFAAGGDFTKALYFRNNYVEYGSVEDHYLPFEAGKRYNIHFNAAAWKDNGTFMKFEIYNESDEIVYEQVVKTTPNVNGNTGAAVNGSNSVDIKFVPETSGNFKLRWIPAINENGDQGDFNEVLLANPSVKYVPNIAGIEEMQLLSTALENAKKTLEENSAERFSGIAFDTLKAAIEKYEAEGPSYTAPSAYRKAAAALDEASQALKDHRALCDTYDPLPKQAQEIIDNNADKKFAATSLYGELETVAAKYVTKTTETQTDPETQEPVEVVVINVKELKDDAELQAAIDELKNLVNTAALLFTEGESKTSDTGVKVAIERLRLGAEGLKSLGVAADDPLVVAANNALFDDDELAESIKQRMKVVLYEQLKNADNTLFEPVLDENTLENVYPTYDMTVFVKNPNIYKQQDNTNFTDENVPGWTTPEGYNRPGLSVGWGQPRGTNEIAEDCMFQTWGSSYRVEQTITDLPAGVYTIKYGFGERNDEDSNVDNYAYASTSETPEGEDGFSVDAPVIGQSFPYTNIAIESVPVVDGILTIGVNAGPSSHTFFNDVRVLIAGSAPGFDYGKAYQDALDVIDENAVQPASIRAIELYDLNGRRITTARKGVVIVKKYMSDGTTRIEKVVKK